MMAYNASLEVSHAGYNKDTGCKGERYEARRSLRLRVEPRVATCSWGYRQNMPSTSSGSTRRILPQR